MTSRRTIAPLAALALFALAPPALADNRGLVQIKAGVTGVVPDESASISTIGGTVAISDEYVPSVQLEYFFTDNISAELLCCVARHEVGAVNTALGPVDLGKITHFPPTLTLKYRWTGLGMIEPYIGAGVNYTHFFDAKLPVGGTVTNISYDDSFGAALQLGADLRIDEYWFINADVRKIWIHSDVAIEAGVTHIDADVDIDPWVPSLSFGVRF
jgi:outer membrane protein